MCIVCEQLSLSTPLPQSLSKAIDTTDFLIGAEGIGDSLYPGFGNGGYDVQRYTLDLNVTDVDTSALNGITTIKAEATQNLIRFNLDFIGFEIDGITVNEQRLQSLGAMGRS